MTTREEATLVLYRSLERVVSEMPRLAEMATQEERAAVVAWLLAGTADCRACMDEAVVRLAREIERGEHRREEE